MPQRLKPVFSGDLIAALKRCATPRRPPKGGPPVDGRSVPDACEIGYTGLARAALRKYRGSLLMLTYAFEIWQVSSRLLGEEVHASLIFRPASSPCFMAREDRMPRSASTRAPDLRQSMKETFAVNDRMNQLVLERLDPRAWRAQLPVPKLRSGLRSRGRNIAAIFAHVHNVRCKWLRLSAPHLKPPPRLDRARCTQQQAMLALAASAALCSRMLAEALAPEGQNRGRVRKFQRDGWFRPWPPGAAMFSYIIVHEAHHRGQVCMLAHQLGFPLPAAHELWGWEKLWKEYGFGSPQ